MDVQIIRKNEPENTKLKVAAYARVSTEEEIQENSIENQIEVYTELIQSNREYEFVKVYYDFGISGFKESRPGFQEMMRDARAGKIDMIYTKSITRFARNTDTFLKAVRELKSLGIGVFFELQNINSLTAAGELLMTVYAAFAQEESQNVRDLTRMSIQHRFHEGRPPCFTHHVWGYTKNEDGEIVPHPVEAAWVKQIFVWVTEGYTSGQIAKKGEAKGIRRKHGGALNNIFICNLIKNVDYKGDHILQKTYKDENRKIKINKGEFPSYYIENDHPPIVSRELWDEANRVIKERWDGSRNHKTARPYTKENYPYKGKLFCGLCGHKLYTTPGVTGSQRSFFCSGHLKDKICCKGLHITEKEVEALGEITENVYITCDPSMPSGSRYSYVKESSWKKKNKIKEISKKVPDYNPENYHYYKRVYCAECGNRLSRKVESSKRIIFDCVGRGRWGKEYCRGIRVPEETLNRLPDSDGYYLIKRDGDGFQYICQDEKPVRKQK